MGKRSVSDKVFIIENPKDKRMAIE